MIQKYDIGDKFKLKSSSSQCTWVITQVESVLMYKMQLISGDPFFEGVVQKKTQEDIDNKFTWVDDPFQTNFEFCILCGALGSRRAKVVDDRGEFLTISVDFLGQAILQDYLRTTLHNLLKAKEIEFLTWNS